MSSFPKVMVSKGCTLGCDFCFLMGMGNLRATTFGAEHGQSSHQGSGDRKGLSPFQGQLIGRRQGDTCPQHEGTALTWCAQCGILLGVSLLN